MASSDAVARVAGAVGAGAGVGLAFLVLNQMEVRGFLPGVIAVCIGVIAGIFLGRMLGSLLFRRPPDNKPLA